MATFARLGTYQLFTVEGPLGHARCGHGGPFSCARAGAATPPARPPLIGPVRQVAPSPARLPRLAGTIAPIRAPAVRVRRPIIECPCCGKLLSTFGDRRQSRELARAAILEPLGWPRIYFRKQSPWPRETRAGRLHQTGRLRFFRFPPRPRSIHGTRSRARQFLPPVTVSPPTL